MADRSLLKSHNRTPPQQFTGSGSVCISNCMAIHPLICQIRSAFRSALITYLSLVKLTQHGARDLTCHLKQSGKILEKICAPVEGHWSHLTFTLTPVHLQKLLILEAAGLWRVEAADRELPRAPLALSATAQQEMPRLQAYQWALSTGTHQPCSGQVNRT